MVELTGSQEANFDALPTRAGYDRWAEIYDEEDNPLIALEEPWLERLLGDVAGLAIIDIGCGTGRHALRWAAAGASVTAVDFSDGMLAKARTKPGAQAVRFVRHDLAQRLPFDDAAFDRVTCCLVLDHIRDLDHLFGEMARICRPDGFVVVSVMHPAMMLRGVQARFTDPTTGRQMQPASAPNQISSYVTAAIGAGLRIDHISEHAVDDVLAARSPRARKYLGWPMLLLLLMRLIPGT
ncbi:MAG: class I SAM-dependent methyltransferase [Phycisphaeraceae bacterium]